MAPAAPSVKGKYHCRIIVVYVLCHNMFIYMYNNNINNKGVETNLALAT